MNTVTRWEPFRGLNSLQEQVNRLFDGSFTHSRSGQAELASWAPAVDIYETENELVVKADLPEVQEKDIDVRVDDPWRTEVQ
jgi:HSP20 family protein